MDKATRILAIPLTSASYPESMDDLLDTISFHWRDSNYTMICTGFARANPEHFMEILKDPDTEGLTILADLLRHSVVSIRFTAQASKYIQR